MELLALELVHYYARQTAAPSAAAIDAVGERAMLMPSNPQE